MAILESRAADSQTAASARLRKRGLADNPRSMRLSQKEGAQEESTMSELIQWRTDWQEALNEAQKANRPLALEFFMDG